MARKLESAAPKADAPSSMTKALDDLYVMQPPVKLDIGGRTITIGEYLLWDGMEARAIGKPLIDDLEAMAKDKTAADAGLEAYLDLISKHRSLSRKLLILAIAEPDRDEAFVNGLQGPDAERLVVTWWGACSRFFWRVVVGRQRDRVMADLRRKTNPAGPTSSTPSPVPATDAAVTSGASTPSVN